MFFKVNTFFLIHRNFFLKSGIFFLFIGLWMPFALNGQGLKKEAKKNVFFGKASYYDEYFNGRHTANGEIFSHKLLTAAHPSWPFNTKVRITNLANSNSVVVRINDRGPYIRGRHIDVSKQAAKVLGFVKTGVVDVKMEVLFWGNRSDSTSTTLVAKLSSPKIAVKKSEKIKLKKSAVASDTTSLAKNITPLKSVPSKTKEIAAKAKTAEKTKAQIDPAQKPDSNSMVAMTIEPASPVIQTETTGNLQPQIAACKILSIQNSPVSDPIKRLSDNPNQKIVLTEFKTTDSVSTTNKVTEKVAALINDTPKSDSKTTFALVEKPSSPITETKKMESIQSKTERTTSVKSVVASDTIKLQNEPIIAKTTSTKISPKTSTSLKPKVTAKNVGMKNTVVKNEIMCTNSDSLSGWCVQVGSYGNRLNAQRTLEKVMETTHEWACIQVIHRNDLPFYRVVCGKNIENKKASEIKQKLSGAYPDAFITNYTVLLNNSTLSK